MLYLLLINLIILCHLCPGSTDKCIYLYNYLLEYQQHQQYQYIVKPNNQNNQNIEFSPNLQAKLQQAQDWLRTIPANYYTVQVMQAYGDKAKDIELLLWRAELQPLFTDLHPHYQVDKQLWIIVYAQFSKLEIAREALDNLPEILQRNRPYILRTIG